MFFDALISIYSRFSDWLIPWVCVICGNGSQSSHNICLACSQDLPILSHSCQRCAQFLPVQQKTAKVCGACLSNPPPFDSTYALFPYQYPIIPLIIQLKFKQQLSVAKALGDLLTQSICNLWYVNKALPDLILPMPLHAQRLRERGFNQALEIAKPVARALAIPLDWQGIKRIKPTLAQSGLPAKARKENIAQAFCATRSYAGLSLAVIDDVITTGHTMTECCRILKQNGAKSIDVWCCARR